jgi:hypothetical protein
MLTPWRLGMAPLKAFVLTLLGAPALSACALGGGSASGAPAAALSDPALAELPPGGARDLLANACTTCHDLGGLSAYRGYWGYEQWRDMVQTMIEHGAELDGGQAETLAQYLTANLGPDAP